MQLFPERDRYGRRLLVIAFILSLILHVTAGALWPSLSRDASRATASEQLSAKLEPITIERLPPAPRPRPIPVVPAAPSVPKRTVVRPARPPRSVVPVFRLPSSAPRPEPTAPPRRAAVHVVRSATVAQFAPRRSTSANPSTGALTEQQIAALDATFRKTIDQAQAAAAAPPAQSAPVRTIKRYNKLLDASITDVETGTGDCDPIEDGTTRGAYTYYYLRCNVHYPDGYAESVEFPWPFRFTHREDPFSMGPGRHHFPAQAPPDGFTLPHPFALSRAICAYYRDECVAVIRREQAAAGETAP